MQMLSSKERIICYSLIFVLLSALVYFVFIGDEEYVEDYNLKIEALEAKVDSLHSINDNLVYKIDKQQNLKVLFPKCRNKG